MVGSIIPPQVFHQPSHARSHSFWFSRPVRQPLVSYRPFFLFYPCHSTISAVSRQQTSTSPPAKNCSERPIFLFVRSDRIADRVAIDSDSESGSKASLQRILRSRRVNGADTARMHGLGLYRFHSSFLWLMDSPTAQHRMNINFFRDRNLSGFSSTAFSSPERLFFFFLFSFLFHR